MTCEALEARRMSLICLSDCNGRDGPDLSMFKAASWLRSRRPQALIRGRLTKPSLSLRVFSAACVICVGRIY